MLHEKEQIIYFANFFFAFLSLNGSKNGLYFIELNNNLKIENFGFETQVFFELQIGIDNKTRVQN